MNTMAPMSMMIAMMMTMRWKFNDDSAEPEPVPS
jgi:hypothetical protein